MESRGQTVQLKQEWCLKAAVDYRILTREDSDIACVLTNKSMSRSSSGNLEKTTVNHAVLELERTLKPIKCDSGQWIG